MTFSSERRAARMRDDEEIELFAEDLDGPGAMHSEQLVPWRVLLVDDDVDVHASTCFALRGVKIFDRPLEFLHAYDARKALELAVSVRDIAVAIVDVVMLGEAEGLELVGSLRAAGLKNMRIVLRTGQPGYAPELTVLTRYDINDYRTKSEFDRTKFISLLTANIRSYHQLLELDETRRGLEAIVASTRDLLLFSDVSAFSVGVLTGLCALCGTGASGVVAVAPRVGSSEVREVAPASYRVFCANGRFSSHVHLPLSEVPEARLQHVFDRCVPGEGVLHLKNSLAMRFKGKCGHDLFIYLETLGEVSSQRLALIDLFSASVAVCFDNVELVHQLDELAFVDQDLGVPNLHAFERDLAVAMAVPRRARVVGLIAVEELDALASTLGHVSTDALLRAFYHETRSCLQVCAPIARVGDCIFGFVASELDEDAYLRLASRHFEIEGVRVWVNATVALVELSPEHVYPSLVIREARTTLLNARNTAPGQLRRFDPRALEELDYRAYLRAALAACLEAGTGVSMHLQPKVDISRGVVVGAEALCRWRHDAKMVSPAVFIPIAEAAGLSTLILYRMIELLGLWQRERHEQGLPVIQVAVNLSMRDVEETGFSDRLLPALSRLSLTPDKVAFEMTEGGMMQDCARVASELQPIVELGYSLAMDDFGTGYSSLAQLHRLPVDVLKIDRALIEPLTVYNAQASIAAASVAMARSLGLETVAEGVETRQQHDAMLRLGCNLCQGYYYGRPVPMEEFERTYGNWSLDRLSEAA